MIAGLELADQRQRHRRHSGRGRARGLGALECRHALLEHRHGRIGEARILEARLFALEAGLGLRGTVVDVALGEKQCFRGLAELRAQRAGMDEAGFRGGSDRVRTRTSALLWPKKKPGREEYPRAGHKRPRPFSDLFYVAASRPAQMTTG